jgi:hypothetical protein
LIKHQLCNVLMPTSIKHVARTLFRLALTRRIYTSMGEPLRCGERVCRRMKRCAGPDLRCARDFPAPPSTPEAWARVQAQIKRAVEARMAELEA